MKNRLWLFAAAGLLAASFLAGCSSPNGMPAPSDGPPVDKTASAPPSEEAFSIESPGLDEPSPIVAVSTPAQSQAMLDILSGGTFDGGVYMNDTLGISAGIPSQWNGVVKDDLAVLLGNQYINGNMGYIFAFFRYPLDGSAVAFNDNLIASVQDVSFNGEMGVESTAEFVEMMLQDLTGYTVDSEPSDFAARLNTGTRAATSSHVDGTDVYQVFYCMMVDNFIISLIYTTSDESTIDAMDKTVGDMKLGKINE